MNEPTSNNNNKQKWIALAVLVLFVLSGGIYQLTKKKGAEAPGTSEGEVTSHQQDHHEAHPSSEEAPSAPKKSKSETKVATGGAQAPSSHSEDQKHDAAPAGAVAVGAGDASTGTATSAAVATGAAASGGIGGFFKSLFGGKKDSAGTPSAPGAQPGSPEHKDTTTALQPTGEAPAPKPVDTCVTVAFHHKQMPGHTDEEACSTHKNLIQLPHENVKQDSICVRVNGTPVQYVSVKGHSDQIVIGAIAGPKSKVTVKYCVGKANCPQVEDCSIPKDEFMEAIGGTEENKNKNNRLGQWDPAHPSEKEADVLARLDGDVKRELATNEDLNGRSTKGEMFKDWIGEEPAPACGMRQAKN